MKIQKKLAVINDLSGYGRCSLTVALPVVSAMGVQCCPVPPAILSNHTAYPAYFFDDYTEKLPAYIGKWKEMGFSFDGILTGFLGSAKQIEVVENFIQYFAPRPLGKKEAKSHPVKVIIDPIMGDHGRVYSTLTKELCDRMKSLAEKADLLTPNLTEACILTDTPYRPHFTRKELEKLFDKLSTLCPGQIVLTGVDMGTYLANLVFDPSSNKFLTLRKKRVAAERCGTGDIFSAVVAAGILNDMPLKDAVLKAASFICLCLKETAGYDVSESDGVVFEPFLNKLMQ